MNGSSNSTRPEEVSCTRAFRATSHVACTLSYLRGRRGGAAVSVRRPKELGVSEDVEMAGTRIEYRDFGMCRWLGWPVALGMSNAALVAEASDHKSTQYLNPVLLRSNISPTATDDHPRLETHAGHRESRGTGHESRYWGGPRAPASLGLSFSCLPAAMIPSRATRTAESCHEASNSLRVVPVRSSSVPQ